MPFIGKNPTAGFASIVKDDFTGNGSTTVFTLSKQVATANDIAVFVGNVRQEPTDAYTVSGTTLTMSAAPATGINFYVLHIAGTIESSVVPPDGSIGTAKLVNNAVTTAKIAAGQVTSAKLDTNIDIAGTLDVTSTLTADGNVLVGTTNTDPAFNNVTGQSMASTGQLQVTRDGGTAALFNRKTSDGEIVSFRKDGGTVGLIGALGGRMFAGSGDVGVFFDSTNDMITPYSTDAGDTIDNTIDLGYSSRRFKNLYLSGGVYLGGTGSANKLDDYEEGTFTPTIGGTATYSRQLGQYTKVGDLCFIHVDIIISTMGTGSVTDLSGLPFTSVNVTGASGHISMSFYQNLNTPTIWIGGYVNNNTDTIYFNGNSSSVQSIALNRFNVFQNGTRLLFSGVYKVA